jgi:hypothetical protein
MTAPSTLKGTSAHYTSSPFHPQTRCSVGAASTGRKKVPLFGRETASLTLAPASMQLPNSGAD